MKTIEERAKEYAKVHNSDDNTNYRVKSELGFIAGAESEHAKLTRWNDPKEGLPEDDALLLDPTDKNVTINVLVKADGGSIFNNRRVQCLRGDEFPFWDWVYRMEGETIIGWREIHQ